MGTAIRPASTTPASWDAFSDVDAFVEEVLLELTAMVSDGTRPATGGVPLIQLLGIEPAVPDHSTLSQRARTLCLPPEPGIGVIPRSPSRSGS